MFTNEQQRIKPEAFASEHSYIIGAFYLRSTLYLFTRGPICILLLHLYSVIEIDRFAKQHQIIPLEVPALILLLDLYSMIEIDHLAEQHQITDSSFSNPTSLQIDHLQESFAS